MVAAGELPFDGPPLADEEAVAAAATGAVASASFLDLLMDDDDVPHAAQLSQAQIIESQARTLAELTKKVEAGDEYRRLTKSKLKEAATRLREYRLRVEELTAALDKAKKQKPTAAGKAIAPPPPRPPMRDAVTQTLPPVQRDMTTQTLQAISPPVVHCGTQTIEAADKQDAVSEKKAMLVHAGVQTLPQAIQPPPIAHCGTQTLDSAPNQDKAEHVHSGVQTLQQSDAVQYGTQTMDTATKQDAASEKRLEVVHSSVQAEQAIQLLEMHFDRQEPRKQDMVSKKNPELVSSGEQTLSKPLQSDAAISNAIDAELELLSSDEAEDDGEGVPVDKDAPALKTKPVASVDAISAVIDDELACSSEDDLDMDIDEDGKGVPVDKDASNLKTKPVACLGHDSAAIDDELASSSEDDLDIDTDGNGKEAPTAEDTATLKKVHADAVSAAIDDELASSSDDDLDMDIDEERQAAPSVKNAPTMKKIAAASADAFSAAIDGDAISAAIDDELASGSEDDLDMVIDGNEKGAVTVKDTSAVKKIPAASMDAVSAAIDDELASSSEDDPDIDIDEDKKSGSIDKDAPTLVKLDAASVDGVGAAIDDELASSSEDDPDMDIDENRKNSPTIKNTPTLTTNSAATLDAISATIDDELTGSSEDDLDMNTDEDRPGAATVEDTTLKKLPVASVDTVSAAIDDELASSSENDMDIAIDGNRKGNPIDNDGPRICANVVDKISDITSTTVRTPVKETEMRTNGLSKRDDVAVEIQLPGSKKTLEHVHLSIQKLPTEQPESKTVVDNAYEARVQAKTNDQQFDAAISSAIDDELDFGSSDSDENDAADKDSESPQPKQMTTVPVDQIIEDELTSGSNEKQQEPADKSGKNVIKNNRTAKTQNAATSDNIPASPTDEEIEVMAPLVAHMYTRTARRFDLQNKLSSPLRSNPWQQASTSTEDESTNKVTALVDAAIDNEFASSSSEDDEINPTSSDQMMDYSDSASPRGTALRAESTSIWAQVMKPSMAPSRNTDPLGNLSDSTSDSSNDSSDDSSDSDAANEEDDAGKALMMPAHCKPANEEEGSVEKPTHSRDGPQEVALDQDNSTEKPFSTEAVKASIQSQESVVPVPRKRSISSANIGEEIYSPTKKQKLVPEKSKVTSLPPARSVEEVASPTKRQKVVPEKSKVALSPPATIASIPQETPAIEISVAQAPKPPASHNPEPVQSVEEPTVDFAKAFHKLISRQEHEKGDDHYVVRTITALKKSSFKAKPDHVAKLCRVLADEYRNRHITPLVMVNGALRAFLAMRKGYSLNMDEPSDLSDICLQVLLRLMRTTNRLHESMVTEKRIALLECLSVLHQALWTSTGSTIALDSFTSSSKLSGATQIGFQHDPKGTKHYVYLAYTCAFFSRLSIAVDSSERVHVLAFDILKNSPTILGLYLVRTIMTVVPHFLRKPLTLIQETMEHAMILIANQSADERELIGDESSMMILSSIASMISRDALSAAVEEDPRRAQKAFVNRIWMQEIDELVSCETTASGSECAQRSFELGKCMELLAVVYDLDGVTRSFSVERFQTVFNECEGSNGFGRIWLVQLAGSIASVVAAKLPDDASIVYVDSVGSWMQQLLRTPSENEPTYPQLQLACVSVCVDLVLALASAKSVVGIWWWSALHWAEQQPTETMWEFPAEFLRRFRLAVLATSKIKAET